MRMYRRAALVVCALLMTLAASMPLTVAASSRGEPVAKTHVKRWAGTSRSDTFDLNSGRPGRQHRDRVYARGGRDYVFMRADGLRDVIRCGSGNDLVMFLMRRERRDRYVSCEKVVPYSP